MSILIPLSQESTRTNPVRIAVEAQRGEGYVTLTVPPDVEHPDIEYRILDPDEARALAAALLHYADEAER